KSPALPAFLGISRVGYLMKGELGDEKRVDHRNYQSLERNYKRRGPITARFVPCWANDFFPVTVPQETSGEHRPCLLTNTSAR
ncbi:hypothetical protein EVAR_17553_1, partial [Eumeta japonica]